MSEEKAIRNVFVNNFTSEESPTLEEDIYPATDEEMIVPKIGKVVDIATKLNDLVERNKIDYSTPEFHTGMQSDQLKEAGSILEYVLRDLLVVENLDESTMNNND